MPDTRYVATLTTYLEMLEPPRICVESPDHEVLVSPLPNPSLAEYLALYNGVGREYHWVDRNRMADEALHQIVNDPAVEILRLDRQGQPAGFAELDRRQPDQIELAYFGLFPEHIGRGLGKYFLNWILHRAWSYHPHRVWVHTCDLDHAAALPNYVKAGFRIYDRKVIQQPISV